ncbi:MAG: hypothetical protein RIC56_12250 [Pseudomonadales bacterium]
MLIRRGDLERIVAGEVTLAFRRWRRATVKSGGTLTTALGVLAIDGVRPVDEQRISGADARRAGYPDRQALEQALRRGSGDVYRIELHPAGADPRLALRNKRPDAAQLAELVARLERLDRASRTGPWTTRTLQLIAAGEAVRAADLAADLGQPKDAFKRNVRKLKNLGLTESLDVGYRLAPRGRALLGHLTRA